jgi:hypothetical protein
MNRENFVIGCFVVRPQPQLRVRHRRTQLAGANVWTVAAQWSRGKTTLGAPVF